MRSVIAFLLCVAVAQLSVGAFSPFLATRAIPAAKAKAKTKAKTKAAAKPVKKAAVKKVAVKKAAAKKAPVKKAAAKKAPVKKVAVKKTVAATGGAKAKLAAKAKAKAVATAKAKAAVKATNKARVASSLKIKAKIAADKKKAAANRPKPAMKKAKVVQTTSATAVRIANSGTDAALAITKSYKNKNKSNAKTPLFPGLQSTSKKPASAFKKDNAKANVVVAKKAARAPVGELKNPLEFGLQVVQSEKGQEAVGILIDGGLKFVDAILSEGKNTKVVISRGYDSGTGELKKPKVTTIGYKELLDAGIFAGTEFFGLAKTNYEKFYVGGEKKQRGIYRTEARIDQKTGKVLKAAQESYVVNIGGERVVMRRPLS